MASAPSFYRASRKDLERASLDGRGKRRLAHLVLHGLRGFKKDPTRAIALLGEAVAAGDSPAAVALGDIYFRGRGAPEDAKAAHASYLRAAELGNAAAQANVGSFFVESNPDEAARWFELAAAQGQPYARTMIKKLRGKEPALPVPTLLEFAMTPLVKLAAEAGADSSGEHEVALACGEDAEEVTEGLTRWLEVLDVAWPLSTVLIELEGEPFDFPLDDLPSAVMEDYESIDISVRPRGADTVFDVKLGFDEDDGFSVKVTSSEPHPDVHTWGWFVAQLETSLRGAGVAVTLED